MELQCQMKWSWANFSSWQLVEQLNVSTIYTHVTLRLCRSYLYKALALWTSECDWKSFLLYLLNAMCTNSIRNQLYYVFGICVILHIVQTRIWYSKQNNDYKCNWRKNILSGKRIQNGKRNLLYKTLIRITEKNIRRCFNYPYFTIRHSENYIFNI
jgi:hypothetical protein